MNGWIHGEPVVVSGSLFLRLELFPLTGVRPSRTQQCPNFQNGPGFTADSIAAPEDGRSPRRYPHLWHLQYARLIYSGGG